MSSIIKVAGIEKLSSSDIKALVDAAHWIGIDPDWLATVISFESAGSFSPSKPNAAGSGAVGLIQFMPSTAKRLGTTTAALARMTFKQQLEYVKKYFAPVRGKLHSLQDTYLTVFYPNAIGKGADDVIGTAPDAVYTQNAGFDTSGKGYITRGDVTATIVAKMNAGLKNPRVTYSVIGFGTILLAAAVGFGAYKVAEKATS